MLSIVPHTVRTRPYLRRFRSRFMHQLRLRFNRRAKYLLFIVLLLFITLHFKLRRVDYQEDMSNLPGLYEYYTQGGIMSGLSVDQPYFTLNGKKMSIYSGAVHYFRVPSAYWRDRLKKLKAAGLNTVETYMPWNLHEPEVGKYDFGEGGTDFQDYLDVKNFLKIAQEEDLFVLMRPGPYICAEWDFGGLPSWLLREEGIQVRTSDEKYMRHVRRYFGVVLSLLAAFQFTRGGPIIGFQVENEYGSTTSYGPVPFTPDLKYIEQLRALMLEHNITELLFTSDSPLTYGSSGSLPTLFQTANFDTNPEKYFDKLKELQKDKPAMAMEYWSGWFDHWGEKGYVQNVPKFADHYERIVKYPASINLYMFHGGTNWGFLNGANMDSSVQSTYEPDTTSYDYGAPLRENGDYSEKYYIVKNILKKYREVKTKIPPLPSETKRVAYPNLEIKQFLPHRDIISKLPHRIESERLVSMENLPINNGNGQSYGYIIYRKKNVKLDKQSLLEITGYVFDTVQVYVNGALLNKNVVNTEEFGFWKLKDSTIILNPEGPIENATIDLVVCNMGRNNFGSLDRFHQFKGIYNSVYINKNEILNWDIYPIEFRKSWTKQLDNWKDYDASLPPAFGMGLYKTELELKQTNDTYIDMSRWQKGIVIVNNFVLGRYWKIGPQQSLYLPAPLLKIGKNEIVIFEEFYPDNKIHFSLDPLYFNNFTNVV